MTGKLSTGRWSGALMVLVICLIGLSSPAQEVLDDTSDWRRTADQAEELLGQEAAEIARLEELRDALAEQRAAALEQAERGSVRALTLEAQLDELGPPPEAGKREPEPLADRRAELQAALSEANAPVIDARAAYRRADLLIDELDARLREQSAERLLTRSPSPLLPSSWESLRADIGTLQDSPVAPRAAPSSGVTGAAWPLGVAIFGAAVLIIFAAEPLVTGVLVRARRKAGSRLRRRLLAALTLVLRLLIPATGLLLISLAPTFLILRFPESLPMVSGVAGAVFSLAAAHVLGHVLFAPLRPDLRTFSIGDALARRGYVLSLLLGLHLALEALLEGAEEQYSLSSAGGSVLALMVVLTGLFPMVWLGTFLRDLGGEDSDGEVGADLRMLFARLLQATAVLAGLFAVAGYVDLARYALEPSVQTVALVGIMLFLRALVTGVLADLFGPVAPNEEEAAVLIPFFVSLLLILAALPLLALIWGARRSDLSEAWRLVSAGIQIGEAQLSLTSVALLAGVFFIGLLVTRWLQRVLGQSILRRSHMDRGVRSSIVTGVGYLGITLAAVIALSTAGISLASLAVVFGALSVGIGFGLQNIVSNFVSGIILLIERPVKEGDWIEVSGYSGYVRKIAVRSTRIETFDRFDVIVPNSDLIAGVVKNMTLTSHEGRLILPIGVAYGSDVQQVRKILTEAAARRPEVLHHPEPVVLFTGLGDSQLEFELRCFLRDIETVLTVRSDLLFDIYASLTEAGIEIPFPQRGVSLKGLEELTEAVGQLATRPRPANGSSRG
ncbi:Small-conductance mechanosensitive channel [Tranquillimonas rosea]|uniref:Small-conductance mechanosensitive channel n=1 Tax=Tranquillimonas rosea TaxID=641238 RepID=A0A1H9TUI7_9RHOB|nr:DUF3772 domain-containing protein [Tranquillimonas rosea]SES00662.1 Small-conductance mechanosensitive channel [Tranquillimonas rosea]